MSESAERVVASTQRWSAWKDAEKWALGCFRKAVIGSTYGQSRLCYVDHRAIKVHAHTYMYLIPPFSLILSSCSSRTSPSQPFLPNHQKHGSH